MNCTGTVNGKSIQLDEPLALPEGTRVNLTITPTARPRKGSPEAILQLAGTLTDEEADAIMKVVQEQRHIDRKLWEAEP